MVSVPCAVAGCDEPKRKRQWCGRHYQAWRRHGDPTVAKYNWSAPAKECAACGKPEIAPNMRQFCSNACRQSEYRERTRPLQKPATACVGCGVKLATGRLDGRSQHQRSRRICASCRKPRRSYRLAVHILAHYQGDGCGICGEAIDMTLRFPNKRCASIDHIVPLALGGTNEVPNLQLAHLDCNAKREVLFDALRAGAIE